MNLTLSDLQAIARPDRREEAWKALTDSINELMATDERRALTLMQRVLTYRDAVRRAAIESERP